MRSNQDQRTQHPWHAAVQSEYSRLAPGYDRRWASYIKGSLRGTWRHLALHPDEHLLDIGCGTGVLLQAIGEAIPDVVCVGVDMSAAMLKIARQRLHNPEMLLLQAAAEHLSFADASFDVVTSTSALHYFANPAAALAEMYRVLRPGGRLLITDWCDDYLTCRLCGHWLKLINRGHFQIYSTQQLHAQLTASGFENIHIERYRINWLWGLMTAVANKAAASPATYHPG